MEKTSYFFEKTDEKSHFPRAAADNRNYISKKVVYVLVEADQKILWLKFHERIFSDARNIYGQSLHRSAV